MYQVVGSHHYSAPHGRFTSLLYHWFTSQVELAEPKVEQKDDRLSYLKI
jgi:hypothetical protein